MCCLIGVVLCRRTTSGADADACGGAGHESEGTVRPLLRWPPSRPAQLLANGAQAQAGAQAGRGRIAARTPPGAGRGGVHHQVWRPPFVEYSLIVLGHAHAHRTTVAIAPSSRPEHNPLTPGGAHGVWCGPILPGAEERAQGARPADPRDAQGPAGSAHCVRGALASEA